MSWLQDHLDGFVLPHMREVVLLEPDSYVRDISKSYTYTHPTPTDMTVIKNAWRSVKKQARGRKILLMGRDVWPFEVLARRENYPTYFDPKCSRQTVAFTKLPFDRKDCVLFDTGFLGSIGKILKVPFILLSADLAVKDTQVFPKLSGARHLALKLESLPKYWKCARMIGEEIFQEFSAPYEFSGASDLTQRIYKDSSPRFNKGRKVLGVTDYI